MVWIGKSPSSVCCGCGNQTMPTRTHGTFNKVPNRSHRQSRYGPGGEPERDSQLPVCGECADGDDPHASTRQREFRALIEAMSEHKRLNALVLTATSTGISHAQAGAPKGLPVRPAWEWMLEGGNALV